MRMNGQSVGLTTAILLAGCSSGAQEISSEPSWDGPTPEAGGLASQAVPLDRKIVREARLTLVVSDEEEFAEKLDRIEAAAVAAGGYSVLRSNSSITVKLPTERLGEHLEAARDLGEVKDESVSATDVSEEHVDLGVRIENARRLRDRLRELAAQGASVSEILEVERELARVTTELERLEAQMRLLENRTTFATLTVRLVTPSSPGPLGWIFYGMWKGLRWLFVWD